MQVSRKFLATLKLHEKPAYRIAQSAGISPVLLSKLVNGIEPIREKDARILAVADVLGLSPEEAFEPDGEQR